MSCAEVDLNDGGREKLLAEKAYEQLLDMILTGRLGVDAPLQERRLADLLQFSRTPVREALGRLEREGLVTRQAGRLLTVREIPVREYIEILHLRRTLETEAAGIAAGKIDAADIDALRDAIHALMRAEVPSSADHWSIDDQLHEIICRASGNSMLVTLVRDLRRRTRIFNTKRMPDRFSPGCQEHLAILDAIESGDEQAARAAMTTHLTNVKLSILRKLGEF
ncbi:GntR family transcriptional regulator [Telmatospirillum sp.]|uniref:GntR family transcriptional regulator n=1 Tax=Telmatospirillum sp. TaxID=2079197 RepID=UPI00283C2FBA|nr:GntR family transcriptional regulator [Telmatospirillum sp.]MDR3439830.1 GntR family transcriptional regulator [Telmatospirillum sp.]